MLLSLLQVTIIFVVCCLLTEGMDSPDCPVFPPLCFHIMVLSNTLTCDWPQGSHVNQSKDLL